MYDENYLAKASAAQAVPADVATRALGLNAATPKQPSHMNMLNNQLDELLVRLGKAEHRLMQIVDRAFGPTPEKATGGGSLQGEPAGLTNAAALKAEGAHAITTRIHNYIDKLEQLV